MTEHKILDRQKEKEKLTKRSKKAQFLILNDRKRRREIKVQSLALALLVERLLLTPNILSSNLVICISKYYNFVILDILVLVYKYLFRCLRLSLTIPR